MVLKASETALERALRAHEDRFDDIRFEMAEALRAAAQKLDSCALADLSEIRRVLEDFGLTEVFSNELSELTAEQAAMDDLREAHPSLTDSYAELGLKRSDFA